MAAAAAACFILNKQDRNTNAILEAATDNGRRLVMGQRYLPEIRQGDKRIIVLNGEPLGRGAASAAGNRNARQHSRRRAVRQDRSDASATGKYAPRWRRCCEPDGLYFVGLDVIGNYLTEVNVTSPTGIQEINALNGVRLESQVVDFVEERVKQLRGTEFS